MPARIQNYNVQKCMLGSLSYSIYKLSVCLIWVFDFLDIDECSQPNDCSQLCNNTLGSYSCYCSIGFKINETDRTECTGNIYFPGGCSLALLWLKYWNWKADKVLAWTFTFDTYFQVSRTSIFSLIFFDRFRFTCSVVKIFSFVWHAKDQLSIMHKDLL